jgi:site-specific recombinase
MAGQRRQICGKVKLFGNASRECTMDPQVTSEDSAVKPPPGGSPDGHQSAGAGRPPDELVDLTVAFAGGGPLVPQTQRITKIFSLLWDRSSDQKFAAGLELWVSFVEQRAELREHFRASWQGMLTELNSVSFFGEAGLPSQNALVPEMTRRLFQRLLPSVREETDAARIFTPVFASQHAVQRFLGLDGALFARLVAIFWDERGLDAFPSISNGLHEAMRLLAARVAGRGSFPGVRQRSTTRDMEESPFYRLIFATEKFIQPDPAALLGSRRERWLEAVYACRGELALVRIHMEDAGVNTGLVFDLSVMDAALDRMELLAALLARSTNKLQATRRLLDTLFAGLLADTRVSALVRQNLNLVARKTVERTGHSGEHYIAQSRKEYWRMWGAAIGGGLVTVFTGAIKLHIVAQVWAPFVEGFLIGTNYAISFLILQIFGLALATKQPSMTAATLADIIRRNRGDERRTKIADFAASISRSQLAAAMGNVIAVSAGAVVFDQFWRMTFGHAYLARKQAEHVYLSLRPLASGTAYFAAATGVLLWMAGMIGGWCENFAIYNRIPEAIAQHPLGQHLGAERMKAVANWVDRNVAPWSNSIALGYLMGFAPQVAHFFGLPMDIRHVTLNTGMFAFSAASFGATAFRQWWLYSAIGGIAVMFVLNLGVSFSIASIVALRAYDVGWQEQTLILKASFKEILRSPLQFLLPVEKKAPIVLAPEDDPEVVSGAVATESGEKSETGSVS